MPALTSDRNTSARAGDYFELPVAASQTVFAGSIVMLNASGYLTPGATATGQVCAGRALQQIDNSAGANGDFDCMVESGVFSFANSAAADLITIAEVGDTCYIVDDQTVAKTDGTGTRSAAGKVVAIDSEGVWVRMGL